MSTRLSRQPWDAVSVGIALGFAADRAFGDPRRFHPVAGFGQWAMAVEKRLYRPTKPAGVLFTATALAPLVAVAHSVARRNPLTLCLTTAAVTWASLGGRSLEREAMAVSDLLAAGDLPGARDRIASLVGRDTSQARGDDLARAVVESLAENQSDAVAATLVWAALAGPAGAALHRGANTLDAMVGYRNERYREFGWASARFDDVLNYLPARVSALATALIHAAQQQDPAAGITLFREAQLQAQPHPSPNAGIVEATAALTLDVRIGGTNTYGGQVENRGFVGTRTPVTVSDVPRAVRLTRRMSQVVLAGALTVRWLARRVH